MKKILAIVLIAAFAAGILSSCQSTGFSCDAVGPALTPDVDATTTERTWKKEPGKNREVPVEMYRIAGFEEINRTFEEFH